jgi:integrase
MKFKKVGGRRNYGYGRSLEFAVRCALRDGYTEGRYNTRRTYVSKFNNFIAFMRNNRIHDFCNVWPSLVKEYAESLYGRVLSGDFSLNYAVDCLSAVNCIMSIMRGDNFLWISPREYLGPRLFVRQDAPETLDIRVVEAAALHLLENGEKRLAGVLRLCSYFGLRYREASLLNVRSALRSARRSGKVTVSRGTKGGRTRTVEVGPVGIDVLRSLIRVVGPADNLIPIDWTFKKWQGYCYRTWRKYASQIGIDNRFKELRAGFACRVYQDVTGAPAPVLAGGRVVDRELDRVARMLVSTELGHGREQIAGAYIGTTRRAPS